MSMAGSPPRNETPASAAKVSHLAGLMLAQPTCGSFEGGFVAVEILRARHERRAECREHGLLPLQAFAVIVNAANIKAQ